MRPRLSRSLRFAAVAFSASWGVQAANGAGSVARATGSVPLKDPAALLRVAPTPETPLPKTSPSKTPVPFWGYFQKGGDTGFGDVVRTARKSATTPFRNPSPTTRSAF